MMYKIFAEITTIYFHYGKYNTNNRCKLLINCVNYINKQAVGMCNKSLSWACTDFTCLLTNKFIGENESKENCSHAVKLIFLSPHKISISHTLLLASTPPKCTGEKISMILDYR